MSPENLSLSPYKKKNLDYKLFYLWTLFIYFYLLYIQYLKIPNVCLSVCPCEGRKFVRPSVRPCVCEPLKQYGHESHDVMKVMMSCKSWCHVSHDVMKVMMSWMSWCHESHDVMKVMMSWNSWCHETHDGTKLMMSWKSL